VNKGPQPREKYRLRVRFFGAVPRELRSLLTPQMSAFQNLSILSVQARGLVTPSRCQGCAGADPGGGSPIAPVPRMPSVVFTSEKDSSGISPRHQLVPSPGYDLARAKEATEAWKMRRRFNPQLIGFGLVGPEPPDLRATAAAKSAPSTAAVNPEGER
jgi:hypothetical protein